MTEPLPPYRVVEMMDGAIRIQQLNTARMQYQYFVGSHFPGEAEARAAIVRMLAEEEAEKFKWKIKRVVEVSDD